MENEYKYLIKWIKLELETSFNDASKLLRIRSHIECFEANKAFEAEKTGLEGKK